MTALLNQRVSTLLLDVEGTTTPIDFVYKILFPYALAHAEQFLKQHVSTSDGRADVEALRQQNLADARQGLEPPAFRGETPEAQIKSAVAYMEWLTMHDRKALPFKSLQGKIWQEGYRSGQLRAQVFDDVPGALKRWHEQAKTIAIFSGGSVLAQKVLFAHTLAGDLTGHISAYFDTTTGNKTAADSYKKIAQTLEKEPIEIVFISDVTTELDAAQSAGLDTLLSVRPGNRPQPATTHRVIETFDQLFS